MKDFVYNPINNKLPKGACVKDTAITYTLKVSKFMQVDRVDFCMHRDNEATKYLEMTRVYTDDRYSHYEYKTTFTEVGFYWYHFEVLKGDSITKLIRSNSFDAVVGNGDNDYLQLVINNETNVDASFRKGIIYHIFVDRFNKSGDVKPRGSLKLVDDWYTLPEKEYENGEIVNNTCYGGNLKGVTEKLSYLKKLNVSTIYLSPIMEANSSHKYNIADYSKIDSMFGSNEDLQELIDKAKRMGIRVIIDGVFNHTGSDSVYFNKNGRYKTVGAYQSPNSKYYSWYEFTNYPNEYSCWWGIKTLPQTNENSGFFDYIAGKKGIINKYMNMGLGGFRLDVVDELSNNFLHAICTAIKDVNPKALVIGEVWEDASSKISYNERKEYFLGGNLDSVTNYPMKNAILDYIKTGNVNSLVSVINLIKDQYPVSIQNNLMNLLDSHDTKRALTILGADESNYGYDENSNYRLSEEERDRGLKLLKLATIIQYTVMGIPTIFYGDEAGIEGMKDPYCRAPYPWGKEDLSLIEWYQKLGNLRNNKVFDGGELNIKYANNSVIIYERVKGNNKVVVGVNRSQEPYEFTLNRTMCNYFTGDYVSGKIIINPDSAVLFV